MSYEASEAQRLQANMIRIGTIAQLDAANARVKVNVSGLTTDWLPWIVQRAGATRTWSAPRAGEQVVVLAPYGDTSQGVVLPSIYQDDHPAPAASQDKESTVYPDGSTVEYDSASNTLTVTVSGAGNVVVNCKQATVNADTSVTLNTPEANCTGNLTVAGVTTTGGLVSTGAAGGAQITGGAQIDGGVTMTGGSVTHDGKNVGSTHTHSGVLPGGGTTGEPT